MAVGIIQIRLILQCTGNKMVLSNGWTQMCHNFQKEGATNFKLGGIMEKWNGVLSGKYSRLEPKTKSPSQNINLHVITYCFH